MVARSLSEPDVPNRRAFLKWPGGKLRLVERIREALGPAGRLIEPFVGSGAVFLNTDYAEYLLADNNKDLIDLYSILQSEGTPFIKYCGRYFQPGCNDKEVYYKRRETFNKTKRLRVKAALFIYLNRLCFNGLCRYNQKGIFNTPFGRYKNPQLQVDSMHGFLQKAPRARFLHADFKETMAKARPGDVVYCDPPYAPLSDTAYFTDYSTGGFGWQQQIELAETARETARRGVPVVISNHATEQILALYAGAELSTFSVRRLISCDGNNRNEAREVLARFSP